MNSVGLIYEYGVGVVDTDSFQLNLNRLAQELESLKYFIL